jgi:hypothetical protein
MKKYISVIVLCHIFGEYSVCSGKELKEIIFCDGIFIFFKLATRWQIV